MEVLVNDKLEVLDMLMYILGYLKKNIDILL